MPMPQLGTPSTDPRESAAGAAAAPADADEGEPSAVGEPMPAHSEHRRRRRLGVPAGIGTLLLLLAGCAKDAPMDVFQPDGDEADTINHLQVPVFIAAGVVGVIVMVAILLTMLKFRRRAGQEDVVPHQLHGNTKLEIGWTILPAVILAGVAVFT